MHYSYIFRPKLNDCRLRLIIKHGSRFKKDYKRILKQNRDLSNFVDVIEKLINKEPLDQKYHDHQITGILKEYRDCHIAPDLILIYSIAKDELNLIRIGSHSELFR